MKGYNVNQMEKIGHKFQELEDEIISSYLEATYFDSMECAESLNEQDRKLFKALWVYEHIPEDLTEQDKSVIDNFLNT